MKLSAWAKQQGISYITAWRWYKTGKLPVPAIKTDSGMILVDPASHETTQNHRVWVYCRVSSHEKKDDLSRQADRCLQFCQQRGWEVMHVTKEIASGMNDSRPKLFRLFEQHPTRLVVEHKDRLTRFGFHYFEYFLPLIGCELIVMNRDQEEKDDLLKDLVAIITSFCCRLYGLRRGQHTSKTIQNTVLCDEPAKSR
jgi:putative resolvase